MTEGKPKPSAEQVRDHVAGVGVGVGDSAVHVPVADADADADAHAHADGGGPRLPRGRTKEKAGGKKGEAAPAKQAGKRGGKRDAAAAGEAAAAPKEKVVPRLRTRYHSQVVPAMMKEFSYGNSMQVPRLRKIVLNIGLGEAVQNVKAIDAAVADMTAIAGQKPVVAKARKSIAAFKLRAGVPIGVTVTLRRARMWDFLDRLLALAIPRARDFKGISPKQFDGRGNFSMGIREQVLFHEINYDKVDKVRGLGITVCTDAGTDREGRALLTHLGFPFRQEGAR